jgi:hypothetical protein
VATRRNGDGPAAVRLHEELAVRLGNRTVLALVMSSVAESLGLEAPDAPDPASPAETVQALARAAEVFRALDRRLTVSPGLLAGVERHLAGASPGDLHSLCLGGLAMGWPALTYAASGEGLAHDGPLLHRFLLARGRVLSSAASRRDRDRAGLCLRAARQLAGRARDMDAVREASAGIDALPRAGEGAPWEPREAVADTEPLTGEDIARLLQAERSRPQGPTFAGTRRKRRRAPRRPQPDLFDDFLAFLEKNV